jgi:hypothetical protein
MLPSVLAAAVVDRGSNYVSHSLGRVHVPASKKACPSDRFNNWPLPVVEVAAIALPARR